MVKVKICGITNLEDALLAAACGADALGFIFAPSPRQVSRETARAIVAELPPFVSTVGVFVDSSRSDIEETMSFCGLGLAQLHGSESPELCGALFPRAIKTFKLGSTSLLADVERFRAALYMLDREKGSTGSPAELWPVAREMARLRRVILAGGLTPENVARAIEISRPYAVDVASGVEASPGRKDANKIKAFVAAARRVEHDNTSR